MDILQKYTWAEDYLWVSLFVASLYTSIPHVAGVTALQHFLSKNDTFPTKQISFLLDLANLIWSHKICTRTGNNYLQTFGTALGARFANLFMGPWEEMFIWNRNPSGKHLVYFGHYINNILIISQGSASRVEAFLTYCNNNPFAFSFTSVVDHQALVFVDLEFS